jgi:hypothetical protein
MMKAVSSRLGSSTTEHKEEQSPTRMSSAEHDGLSTASRKKGLVSGKAFEMSSLDLSETTLPLDESINSVNTTMRRDKLNGKSKLDVKVQIMKLISDQELSIAKTVDVIDKQKQELFIDKYMTEQVTMATMGNMRTVRANEVKMNKVKTAVAQLKDLLADIDAAEDGELDYDMLVHAILEPLQTQQVRDNNKNKMKKKEHKHKHEHSSSISEKK